VGEDCWPISLPHISLLKWKKANVTVQF
jgi:hypothetical protein